ncbi:hypothetical protein TWF696_003261 [Orbilia brochopaga]|uniref:Rhodopsin domain-containing protein n=1 Tax=Orbilia brochopaga TaxID=3140254 RepID=A0AAV9U138_9PEZI
MGQIPSHVLKPTTEERNELFALFAEFANLTGTTYLTTKSDSAVDEIAVLYSPEYVPPNMNGQVLVLSIVVLVCLVAAISLRFYSRYRYGYGAHKPLLDDWLVLLATLSCMAYTFVNLYAFLYVGFGRFTYDLTLKQFDNCLRLIVVNFAIFAIANSAVKVSILVLYRRLFDSMQTKMRLVVYILIGIVIVFCPISLIVQVVVCKPVHAFWRLELRADPNVHCGDGAIASYIVGGIRTILDLIIFALPVKHIWDIKNFSRRKKIMIISTFWFGLIACVGSILKLILYAEFAHADITREIFRATVAESLEFTSAIIAACLPALLPMLKAVFRNASNTIRQITNSSDRRSQVRTTATHISTGPMEYIKMKGINVSHAVSQTVESRTEDDTELILVFQGHVHEDTGDDKGDNDDKGSKIGQIPSVTGSRRQLDA